MTSNVLLMAGFFLFVLAMVTIAGYFLLARRERLEPDAYDIASRIGVTPDPAPTLQNTILGLLQSLGESMPASESSRLAIERRLDYAGYRHPVAFTSYFGLKCTCALVIAFIFCAVAFFSNPDRSMLLAAFVSGLGLGFLAPERVLDSQISRRNDRLRRALPPALDLIVMSLEAGQPLDQALLLASRGLQRFSPDLSGELMLVYLQTRASNSRAESIRLMGERNSEGELRKFCALLLDSDRFGSSLAPTLRQHSRYLRIRFRQRAQESARKLTVKLIFPVFFLIFPTILVVTLAPAVLTMYKYFQNLWN